MQQNSITNVQRRLKAVWSLEAAQDLRCIYGIEAGEQLSDLIAKEITNEIDEEILRDLVRNAKFKKSKKMARSIDDDWQVSCDV